VLSPNLLQVVSIPMPTYRATGTQSHQSSPPLGPRRIQALRWLLSSLRIRNRDAQPTCQRPSAPPNTSSKASNSVGEDSALRLLASFAR
jgi:hypothetical protein